MIVHGLQRPRHTEMVWSPRTGTYRGWFLVLCHRRNVTNLHGSHIDNLPLTVQTAINEIERYTGFKALVLVGGPEPSNNGKIATHLYVQYLSFFLSSNYQPATQLGNLSGQDLSSHRHGAGSQACDLRLSSG